MAPKFSRREAIVGAAALSAVGCGPAPHVPPVIDPQPYDSATRVAFSPKTIAESEVLFPQTVSSGAMQADSALLWTRTTSAGPVLLKVWRDVNSETEVALVKSQSVAPSPETDGNLKVVVDSLAPATWYSYAFFSEDLGLRSPIGKFRTAFPADWKESVTVGATSCASWRYRPFKPLEALARQPIDLWLHLGDVSYNDMATSLDGFRQLWQEQLKDPGYRALMPTAGGYLVWDDHDFTNNFDPEALGPNSPIVIGGARTFRETLPVEEDRSWRSYRWGQTVEFFLLDVRTERKPSTRETADAQFISPAQLAWLQAALVDSPCHFKAILTSVPITTMPPPLWGFQADRWQGYAAQREHLLSFIDSHNLDNVWFISGDIHLGTVMRLERQGPYRKYKEICVGPAGNINPLSLVLVPGQERNREVGFPSDQFLYAGGTFQATTLTFDPQSNTVKVVFVDPAQGESETYNETLRFGDDA